MCKLCYSEVVNYYNYINMMNDKGNLKVSIDTNFVCMLISVVSVNRSII